MMKDKKVSFHIFPVDQKRRDKWIVAVKRVNSDGSGWQPTRYTVLCGEHFMTGKNVAALGKLQRRCKLSYCYLLINAFSVW